MRLTLSIPDSTAYRFQVAVPPRQRSKLVTQLLEKVLSERDNALASVCHAANQDWALEQEVDEWHAFEEMDE